MISNGVRRAASVVGALTLLTSAAAMPAIASAGTPPTQPGVIGSGPNFLHLPAPLSTSDCLATYGVRCYGVPQLHTAYDLNALYRKGTDGSGTTIVVAIPFGSPTIRHDLAVFDRQFHLPDPELRIMPLADFPPYDPTDIERVEWAAATTQQVEDAHAIAPGARIVLAEVANSDFPALVQGERTLIDEGIGDVITTIEVAPESSFPGVPQGDDSSLLALRGAYQDAAAHHVTMLAPAGNGGVSANWPATDPLVTAVGGSQMYLDDAGHRLRPDTTWNDGFGTAGGGGVSTVFDRPSYQSGVAGVVGAHRGEPDITMTASVNGGGWVYTSFDGTGGIGWDIFDGTGESTALFAGIVALADQTAGHRLGLINPALYRLGGLASNGVRSTGIVDITRGDNTLNGVPGNTATRGYDLATGWGTLDARFFVPALAGTK
jgi:subtilase family serine protease